MKRRPSTMLIPDSTGPILISPIAISQRVNNNISKHKNSNNNLTKEQQSYMRQKWVANLRKKTQVYASNNNNLLASMTNDELKYLPFATQGKNMPPMHLGVNIAPCHTVNTQPKIPRMPNGFDTTELCCPPSEIKDRRQYEEMIANASSLPSKRTVTQRSKWMKRLLKKRGGPTMSSLAKMKSPRRKMSHRSPAIDEMEYYSGGSGGGNGVHRQIPLDNNEVIEPYPFLSPRHGGDIASYPDASLFSGLGTPSNFLRGCTDAALTYGFNNAIWDIPRENAINPTNSNIPPTIGCANFELDMTCLDTLLVETSPRWLNNSHPLTPLNLAGVSRRLSVSGTIRLTGTPKPLQKILTPRITSNKSNINSGVITNSTNNNNQNDNDNNERTIQQSGLQLQQSIAPNHENQEINNKRININRSIRIQGGGREQSSEIQSLNQYVHQQTNFKIMKTEYMKSPSLLRRHSLAAATHKETIRTISDVVMPDLSNFLDDYKVTDIDKELDNFYMEKIENII